LELGKLRQETPSSDVGDEALTGIDVHSAVFTRMVDVKDSLCETFSCAKWRNQFHSGGRLMTHLCRPFEHAVRAWLLVKFPCWVAPSSGRFQRRIGVTRGPVAEWQ